MCRVVCNRWQDETRRPRDNDGRTISTEKRRESDKQTTDRPATQAARASCRPRQERNNYWMATAATIWVRKTGYEWNSTLRAPIEPLEDKRHIITGDSREQTGDMTTSPFGGSRIDISMDRCNKQKQPTNQTQTKHQPQLQ